MDLYLAGLINSWYLQYCCWYWSIWLCRRKEVLSSVCTSLLFTICAFSDKSKFSTPVSIQLDGSNGLLVADSGYFTKAVQLLNNNWVRIGIIVSERFDPMATLSRLPVVRQWGTSRKTDLQLRKKNWHRHLFHRDGRAGKLMFPSSLGVREGEVYIGRYLWHTASCPM